MEKCWGMAQLMPLPSITIIHEYQLPKNTLKPVGCVGKVTSEQAERWCHPATPRSPSPHPPTPPRVPLFPRRDLQLTPHPWEASAAALVAPRCHPARPQQTPPASPPAWWVMGNSLLLTSSRSWAQILASLALPLMRFGTLRGTVTAPWRGEIFYFSQSLHYTEKKLLTCTHTHLLAWH